MDPTATPSPIQYVPKMRVSLDMPATELRVVPDPPPVAWMFDTMIMTITANTHEPMAK